MEPFIPLSVPNLKGNELKYVTQAIETEWVSSAGSMINRFEEEIAAYLNVSGAVACQSGTAGLHLALLVSGIGRDDEVIVPTLTFIAAVNPVRYVGAEPLFFDCDETLCLDIAKLERFFREECLFIGEKLINKQSRKHIKAIVAVHVFGNMVDMARLMPLAKQYNLIVIEDATEALGSYYTAGAYQGKYAGTIGDMGVFSFNGNKIITTGGGGMLVASDSGTLQQVKYLSTQAKDDEIHFVHHEVGYNYRMTNLQAALGVAQLEQLERFIEIKKRNYDLYAERISSINGFRLLPFNKGLRPNYWFYSLYIDNSSYSTDDIIAHFTNHRIQTRPVWGLIHQQRPYHSCTSYRIEKAIDFYNRIVNVPCSTNLDEDDVLRVIRGLMQLTGGFDNNGSGQVGCL